MLKFPPATALLALTLAACASDKPAASGAATSGGQAVTTHEADACPKINGTFEYAYADDNATERYEKKVIQSREQDGTTAYLINAQDESDPWLTADGKTHSMSKNGDTGTFRLACSNNALEIVVNIEGKGTSTLRLSLMQTGDLSSAEQFPGQAPETKTFRRIRQ